MYSSMGAGGSANSWGIPNYSRTPAAAAVPTSNRTGRNYSRVSAFEMEGYDAQSLNSSYFSSLQKNRWQRFLLIGLGVGIIMLAILRGGGEVDNPKTIDDAPYSAYPDYANYNDNNNDNDNAGLRGSNPNPEDKKQNQQPQLPPDNHHQEGHDTYFNPHQTPNKIPNPHAGGLDGHGGDRPDRPTLNNNEDPYTVFNGQSIQQPNGIVLPSPQDVIDCIKKPPATLSQVCQGSHDQDCLSKGCTLGTLHTESNVDSKNDCVTKPPTNIEHICHPLKSIDSIHYDTCLNEGCKLGVKAAKVYAASNTQTTPPTVTETKQVYDDATATNQTLSAQNTTPTHYDPESELMLPSKNVPIAPNDTMANETMVYSANPNDADASPPPIQDLLLLPPMPLSKEGKAEQAEGDQQVLDEKVEMEEELGQLDQEQEELDQEEKAEENGGEPDMLEGTGYEPIDGAVSAKQGEEPVVQVETKPFFDGLGELDNLSIVEVPFGTESEEDNGDTGDEPVADDAYEEAVDDAWQMEGDGDEMGDGDNIDDLLAGEGMDGDDGDDDAGGDDAL